MLPVAIVLITTALVFYTVGVWGEKIKGRLSVPWFVFFWAGFICDTAGTAAMSRIAGTAFDLSFHGITGILAIVLMAAHATWATIVLVRKNERAILGFHRFSVVVWLVWLVPYLSGVVFGVNMGG